MQPLLEVPGHLQLWLYTVGHSTLLLRRNRNEHHGRRVDILFKGVEQVRLRESYEDLRLEMLSDGDPEYVRPEQHGGGHVVRLAARNGTGLVVAGAMFVCEDDGDHADVAQADVPELGWPPMMTEADVEALARRRAALRPRTLLSLG